MSPVETSRTCLDRNLPFEENLSIWKGYLAELAAMQADLLPSISPEEWIAILKGQYANKKGLYRNVSPQCLEYGVVYWSSSILYQFHKLASSFDPKDMEKNGDKYTHAILMSGIAGFLNAGTHWAIQNEKKVLDRESGASIPSYFRHQHCDEPRHHIHTGVATVNSPGLRCLLEYLSGVVYGSAGYVRPGTVPKNDDAINELDSTPAGRLAASIALYFHTFDKSNNYKGYITPALHMMIADMRELANDLPEDYESDKPIFHMAAALAYQRLVMAGHLWNYDTNDKHLLLIPKVETVSTDQWEKAAARSDKFLKEAEAIQPVLHAYSRLLSPSVVSSFGWEQPFSAAQAALQTVRSATTEQKEGSGIPHAKPGQGISYMLSSWLTAVNETRDLLASPPSGPYIMDFTRELPRGTSPGLHDLLTSASLITLVHRQPFPTVTGRDKQVAPVIDLYYHMLDACFEDTSEPQPEQNVTRHEQFKRLRYSLFRMQAIARSHPDTLPADTILVEAIAATMSVHIFSRGAFYVDKMFSRTTPSLSSYLTGGITPYRFVMAAVTYAVFNLNVLPAYRLGKDISMSRLGEDSTLCEDATLYFRDDPNMTEMDADDLLRAIAGLARCGRDDLLEQTAKALRENPAYDFRKSILEVYEKLGIEIGEPKEEDRATEDATDEVAETKEDEDKRSPNEQVRRLLTFLCVHEEGSVKVRDGYNGHITITEDRFETTIHLFAGAEYPERDAEDLLRYVAAFLNVSPEKLQKQVDFLFTQIPDADYRRTEYLEEDDLSCYFDHVSGSPEYHAYIGEAE